jgi:hypothetical protein
MCAEFLHFWSPKEAETETTAPAEPMDEEAAKPTEVEKVAYVEIAREMTEDSSAAGAKLTVVDSAAAPAEPMEVTTAESNAPASATASLLAVAAAAVASPAVAAPAVVTVASPKPNIASATSATAASSAVAATSAKVAMVATTQAGAPIKPAAITASSAKVVAPATTSAVALASFKFCGPLEASEEAEETKEDHDQSALQLLEVYSSDDEIQFHIRRDDPESETEDGEVKDAVPNTSTPTDLAKSLEKEMLRARERTRKKLELSPSKNKVCINSKNLDPVQEPAVVPVLVHEVQAASGREASDTKTEDIRPRRSCAIGSYYRDNYVLSTNNAKPKVAFKAASKSRRHGKGFESTENPSIRQLLKPTGASTKIRQEEALSKPKVASAKSQTLMQDFFHKNA